ncbi:hypothetical protein [Paracidovorax konjaci]|uniref:hypothetical protein n=1 Tax=Paracidovorax konjaci TaxID=32040 RepID=UPI001586FBDA|nr:hypothetical protein [Paracidovorax konjaci]
MTIEQEMRKEAGYLRSLRLARERVKQVIEGPDTDIDRIIRSVRDNGGQVSNKLAREFPALADEIHRGRTRRGSAGRLPDRPGGRRSLTIARGFGFHAEDEVFAPLNHPARGRPRHRPALRFAIYLIANY